MLQPFLVESRNNIQKKVAELVRAKNDLLAEVATLSSLVQNEVLPKFWSIDIAQSLLWIETV